MGNEENKSMLKMFFIAATACAFCSLCCVSNGTSCSRCALIHYLCCVSGGRNQILLLAFYFCHSSAALRMVSLIKSDSRLDGWLMCLKLNSTGGTQLREMEGTPVSCWQAQTSCSSARYWLYYKFWRVLNSLVRKSQHWGWNCFGSVLFNTFLEIVP